MPISTAVIGTVFIDCKGFAREAYMPDSRNLGTIQFVHGGVGRNVAENLANVGLPVSFVSTVDTTGMGMEVMQRLKKAGVKPDFIGETTHSGMGMWLAILEEHGNLAGSISQMPDLGLMADLIERKGEELVRTTSHIVLELDLNEEISRKVIALAEKYRKPVYGVPGNLDVVLQHPDLLKNLESFICNHFEAERLLDAPLDGLEPDAVIELLRPFAEAQGLRSMVITLGAKGSVYYEASTGTSGYQPVFPVKMVDSSGAGDAFFSGTVMGLIRGLTLKDAVVCGTKIAGWTIESAENNCQDLHDKINQDTFFKSLDMVKI